MNGEKNGNLIISILSKIYNILLLLEEVLLVVNRGTSLSNRCLLYAIDIVVSAMLSTNVIVGSLFVIASMITYELFFN